jgi:pilus assembly protein FimV
MVEASGDIDSLTDIDIDESLLEATGQTQVLSDDLAVETMSDLEKALVDEDETMLAPADNDMDADVADDQATLLSAPDDEGDFVFAKTEALPPDAFTGTADADETGDLPAIASTDVDLDLDDLTAALKISEMGDTIEMPRDEATVEQLRPAISGDDDAPTVRLGPDELSDDLHEAHTMTEVGTKLDLARAYVDMGDPTGAKSILKEVLDEGDESQQQQAQQLLDSLPG